MKPIKYLLLTLLVVCTHLHIEAKRVQEYHNIEFQIDVNSNTSYAIAVLDKREVVTSGSQGTDFVGYIRSTTAIAWPIRTESNNSFTDDVSFTVKNAIEKAGAKVTLISTDYTMNSKEIVDKLKTTNADKLILIIIDKWRSDTKSYFSKIATDMIWDLTIQVFDDKGLISTENNVSGRDDAIDPSKRTNKEARQKIINMYYKEKMENLFSGIEL